MCLEALWGKKIWFIFVNWCHQLTKTMVAALRPCWKETCIITLASLWRFFNSPLWCFHRRDFQYRMKKRMVYKTNTDCDWSNIEVVYSQGTISSLYWVTDDLQLMLRVANNRIMPLCSVLKEHYTSLPELGTNRVPIYL